MNNGSVIENLFREIMLNGRIYSVIGPDGSEIRKFKGDTKEEAVTILLSELEDDYIQRHLNLQRGDK